MKPSSTILLADAHDTPIKNPDGQRFLINTTSADDPSTMLTVVLNWQSGLPQR